MKQLINPLVAILVTMMAYTAIQGQPGRRPGPPRRRHMVNQSPAKLSLVPATQKPPSASMVSVAIEGDHRVIRANGIPSHDTRAFPNQGNPHSIAEQSYEYRIPADPKTAPRITPLGMHNFGIAVNGVPFDPEAAEWYLGDPSSPWQYEPLSGAIGLGIDVSHAHVQPTGAYHYHGLPTDLLKTVKIGADRHSPIVGWAADGFPIYAVYGYSDSKDAKSKIQALKSSYRLKEGNRPGGRAEPGGQYDGTFVADYEFMAGSGDLDECNGRFGVTPDFPNGIYAYFLTEGWPVIPRCYRGTPSEDFIRRGPPQRLRPPFRR